MTDIQKNQIMDLRQQGYGYATIAKAVGLKKDTVVAFCRRTGLTGRKASDNSRINLDSGFCLQCGSIINCKPQKDDILKAIDKAYKIDCSNIVSPYYKPNTADNILDIIKNYDLKDILKKVFYNIEVPEISSTEIK